MKNSILYLNHFELARSPFQQQHNSEIFFKGGGHPALLQALLRDIEAGKPLIKLTGNAGTGKTLLSILLTDRIPSDTYDIVHIDTPAGSFDNLLRILCHAINDDAKEGLSRENILDQFTAALHRKKDEQRKVLLIVDNAEKIFLATLERLVKLICDTDARCLQVLLIGRLELDHNLNQLKAYCANVDIQKGHLLEPLDREQTKAYLQYRLLAAGARGYKHQELFSDEVTNTIYQEGQSNIHIINMLAEKGLRKACDAGMFQVDPEFIHSSSGRSRRNRPVGTHYKDLLLANKWWIAASVVLLFLLLILFNQEEKQAPRPEVPAEDIVIEEMAIEIPEIPEPEEKKLPPTSKETAPEEAVDVQEDTAPSKQNGISKEIKSVKHHKKEIAGKTDEPSALPLKDERLTQIDVAQNITTIEKPTDSLQEEPEPAGTGEDAETVAPEPKQETAKQPEGTVSDHVAIKSNTRKILVAINDPIIIQPDGRKKKRPLTQEQAQTTTNKAPPKKSSSAIFKERLKATSEWLAWSYKGGHTIQLMALTSEAAEQNFIQMLDREEYNRVSDKMYIIRRNTPKALFVFYGKYNTLKEAQKEKDHMPPFLQTYTPYALSIKEALRKIDY